MTICNVCGHEYPSEKMLRRHLMVQHGLNRNPLPELVSEWELLGGVDHVIVKKETKP